MLSATSSAASAVAASTHCAASAPLAYRGHRPDPKPSLLRARSPSRSVFVASIVRMTNSSSPILRPSRKNTPLSGLLAVTPSMKDVTQTAHLPLGDVAALFQVGFFIQSSNTQWHD